MTSVLNSANKQTKEAKIKGVNMMRVVGRRVMGVTNERNPIKCTSCGRVGHTAANCYVTRPCHKCGRYGHTSTNYWGRNPVKRGNKSRTQVNEVQCLDGDEQAVGVPQSEPFTVIKEEWSPVEPGPVCMIKNEVETWTVGLESCEKKKLFHVKTPITKERRPVTALIDTNSSCNMIQKGYYRKHGLVIQPCKKQLTGFNGSISSVSGMVEILLSIGK